MKKLTLDTNCLIELETPKPGSALHALRDQLRAGRTTLRVPAIAASERQRGGQNLPDLALFRQRLASIGLDDAELLRPMAYIGLCYWNWCVWSDPELEAEERQIHEILFPSIAFDADAFCPAEDLEGRARWRNAKCDVQSIWCHIHYSGDIYVTLDGNFLKASKKPRLEALGAGLIATPELALTAI